MRGEGFKYAPGLDGVRALAVLAVVGYHLGTTGEAHPLVGGYLGVDVFFVLSGYLITSLLITEAQQSGHISIKKFYLRRARRLLPALYALLIVIGLAGAFWLTQQAGRLKGDLIAAVTYVTNWWLIAENSSYFGAGGDRPPLLTHLWSLAVEEQYYVIWPLVLILFFRLRAKRGVMLFVLLAAVAGSTVLAASLYDPWSDPSRVYYGTDTRALAPLLGAALAIALRPWRHTVRISERKRLTYEAVGGVGLLGLALTTVLLKDNDPFLYQGGFGMIAVFAAFLVAAAGHPATGLGAILSVRPLRWLGDRSYALYLWHWPVCVVTRPGIDIQVTGWANAGLRLGISILLAELSFWLVERPIRRGGFFASRVPSPVRPVSAQPAVGARGRVVAVARVGPAARARLRLHTTRIALVASLVLVAGTITGVQLAAYSPPDTGGAPVDAGPEATLGPLPSVTPSVTGSGVPPTPPVPRPGDPKPKVVFFGDSQGMTLLINKPADLGKYVAVTDATIEGCGVLLGRVTSRSGERRDLAANCPNWLPEWRSRAEKYRPDLGVIMVGAWEPFDLTVPAGTKLTFGSPEWDAAFTAAMNQGIDAIRQAGARVAISLLPCYRPIRASAGYWPERGDDPRTRHINDVLRQIATASGPAVTTLEPPVEFCTNQKIATDRSYRWDGIHYYKKGAALYFKAVLPQILQLTSLPPA